MLAEGLKGRGGGAEADNATAGRTGKGVMAAGDRAGRGAVTGRGAVGVGLGLMAGFGTLGAGLAVTAGDGGLAVGGVLAAAEALTGGVGWAGAGLLMTGLGAAGLAIGGGVLTGG